MNNNNLSFLNKSCACVNVEMGSYDNQVELKTPGGLGFSSETVCVDACCVDAVKYLWSHGIKTYGSCCGHGLIQGFINVGDGFENVISLGFSKHIFNESLGGMGREDTVNWPVSIKGKV